MIYLFGSIVLSSYLTLSFKMLERLGIPAFQAIVFNYITCVITGSLVMGKFPVNSTTSAEPWFWWAVVLGTFFITTFNIIAFTAQKIGVSVASVSNKLSLVIPFLFSIYLYNEAATVWKIIGIAIALGAVYLTCLPSKSEDSSQKSIGKLVWFMPAILFLASGLIDTMVKYVETSFLNETNQDAYLITSFGTAAVWGLLVLGTQLATGKAKLNKKAIIAGIAIGIPNYFSIWCLVHVLKHYSGNSSAIIPINNMGIVLFSTVMAWWIFKERLSKLNWMGIALSLLAIAAIAYG